MYLLDGKPLRMDVAFTHNDIQYPANWLRCSTQEDRDAIGIVIVPDPEPYDGRFYLGRDPETGELIPADHSELVVSWVEKTKTISFQLLQPTDWQVARKAETGKEIDANVAEYRDATRAACDEREAAIQATKTTDELAQYINSEAYTNWPVLHDPAIDPIPD